MYSNEIICHLLLFVRNVRHGDRHRECTSLLNFTLYGDGSAMNTHKLLRDRKPDPTSLIHHCAREIILKEALEYFILMEVRDEAGKLLSRQSLGVGAIDKAQKRVVSLRVEMSPAGFSNGQPERQSRDHLNLGIAESVKTSA